MLISNTLDINQLQILRYVKTNHFEAHLMVLSRVVYSKVLRMAIQFEYFSSEGKMANVMLGI